MILGRLRRGGAVWKRKCRGREIEYRASDAAVDSVEDVNVDVDVERLLERLRYRRERVRSVGPYSWSSSSSDEASVRRGEGREAEGAGLMGRVKRRLFRARGWSGLEMEEGEERWETRREEGGEGIGKVMTELMGIDRPKSKKSR